MTPDPLDSLKGFYDECHSAPVPDSLLTPPRGPWWRGLLVPLLGLGLGCAVAIALVQTPPEASASVGMDTARAFALRVLPLPPSETRSERTGRGPWSA